jgi:hypothetical protein
LPVRKTWRCSPAKTGASRGGYFGPMPPCNLVSIHPWRNYTSYSLPKRIIIHQRCVSSEVLSDTASIHTMKLDCQGEKVSPCTFFMDCYRYHFKVYCFLI